MHGSKRAPRAFVSLLFAFHLAPAEPARAGESDLDTLRRQVEALASQNAAMQDTIQRLESEVRGARDQARAAEDAALDARARAAALPPVGAGTVAQSTGATGRPNLQLLDVSLDVLSSAGWSSATDEELLTLQGGGHDPRQRGFNLSNVELSLSGAVDPYFTGEAHLVYFLDPEGESRFELEEAFVQTKMLPFGLEEHGLQVEAGQFLTEFGRLNPKHPHAWHWQDQPVVLSRFFGEDGLRGPGVRAGWLTPLPWFSEVHLGLQNAKGETMTSFLASDEVFEERPIGGRPFAGVRVGSPSDLVKLLRFVNGFDLSETVSTQVGVSGLLGPNATGPDGRTLIYGADAVVKWRPLSTDKGWPFVVFETEVMGRHYRADDFLGCVETEPCSDPVFFPKDTLEDWGGYAQMLWGFKRPFAVGLRGEYASGHGASVGVYGSRPDDPFRSNRTRISPLLVYHPSEFSRLRLQYNYDHADDLDGRDAHSVWAGLEFLFGAHAAHSY